MDLERRPSPAIIRLMSRLIRYRVLDDIYFSVMRAGRKRKGKYRTRCVGESRWKADSIANTKGSIFCDCKKLLSCRVGRVSLFN